MTDPELPIPPSEAETPKLDKLPSERERLELEKLRLELAELSRPWWARLTNLAPLATITVAITGLIWATANGYFDLARRKNELDKQQLVADNRELEIRKKLQQRTVDQLVAQKQSLERLIRKYEPIVTSAEILSAPWLGDRGFEVALSALNIGRQPGTVKGEIYSYCRLAVFGRQELVSRFDVTVTRWNDLIQEPTSPNLSIKFPIPESLPGDLKSLFSNPFVSGQVKDLASAGSCDFAFTFRLQRADGRSTDFTKVLPHDASRWFLGLGH